MNQDLNQRALHLLQTVFGYPAFRGQQADIVGHVSHGGDALVLMPTGGGKSLCYQIPALLRDGVGVVVSPLIALMQDQVDALAEVGVRAAFLNSTQTYEEASRIERLVRTGGIDVVYVAPERLMTQRCLDLFQASKISLFAIDEAHCVAQWGHDFRPEYIKLSVLHEQFPDVPRIALTATADPQTRAEIALRLQLEDARQFVSSFDRPNIRYQIVEKANGRKQLLDFINTEHAGDCGIVYCLSRKKVEETAEFLNQSGIRALPYHAGMEYAKRSANQARFLREENIVMVATIAFGMGIDKSDIRNVVHFDLPKSIENYSQEIGRAGRDGAPSDCLVLANRDSLNVLENFVYGDTPEHDGIRCVLEDVLDAIPQGQWEFLLGPLADQSNIRQLPLKTLLVQLELRGLIAPRYSYFAEYRFKFLLEPEALVQRFEGERQQFVQALIDTSTRARTWATVNFDTLYQQHQAERGRVVTALDYFHEKGWIELESKQVTEVYSVLVSDFDADALSAELHEYFTQHETTEVARIHAMLDLFASEQCLSQRLADYFGDHHAPQRCGHCSVCLGDVARLPEPPALPALATKDFPQLCGEFIRKHEDYKDAAPGVECLTRFLCGISVPLFTKLKARAIGGFAALEDYPYAQVREWVRANGRAVVRQTSDL